MLCTHRARTLELAPDGYHWLGLGALILCRHFGGTLLCLVGLRTSSPQRGISHSLLSDREIPSASNLGDEKGPNPALSCAHYIDLRSYHVSQSMLSLFSAFLVVYMIRHSYSMCESYLGTCTIFANYIHHDEVGRHRSAHAIRQPAVLISSNCWARAVKILQCIDYDPPACSRRDLLAWTRHSNFLRAISEQLTHRVCLMMFSTDIHWNNVTGSRLLSCPTIEDEHFTWVLWETRS